MRLGTCIALELAVAAGAVGGVCLGVGSVVSRAGDYLATREAGAATLAPAETAGMPVAPQALPTATLKVELVSKKPPNNIFGVHDDDLLAPLAIAPVKRVKLNHGGTSLSLRIDFANGARASFKPEQVPHPQSDPRREIAAFRMDRLLGIGHVSPTKEATFTVKELLDVAEPGYRAYITARLTDEATIRYTGPGVGVLYGELQWWIPEIQLARIGPHRIDEHEGRELWTQYLQIGAQIPPEYRPLVEQLSACLLFDVLIDNPDRWSGSNTEMSPDGKTLFFMDNSMSFGFAKWGHEYNVGAMRRAQVFPRALVRRIRELRAEDIEAALQMPADSKLGALLRAGEIPAILSRRDAMVRYIDQLIAKYGEDAVLAFP